MSYRVGARLRSAVCDTEVVVVRSPSDGVDLRCGGVPMLPISDERDASTPLNPRFGGGTLLGKRYTHEAGLEVLCTKPGAGTLSVGEVPLKLAKAKPLPASD